MNVGLLCGSLGARSANAALLDVAGDRTVSAGHGVSTIEGLPAIAAFDPALVDEPPSAVADLRRQVRACDAVLVAAPEYAAGVSGAVKNALDWLVGDATLHRKVLGVASAGTTGGVFAIEQLVRTSSCHGGWVVATLGIPGPRTKSDDHGRFIDGDTLDEIRTWADTVLGAVEGTPSHRASLLASIVSPYGIDPARFGTIE